MIIAVVSDIHSNIQALASMMEALKKEPVEQIFCLGDTVGYGAKPNECIDVLKKSNILSVMGNHEHFLMRNSDFIMNSNAEMSIGYSGRVLTKDNLKFIRKLPMEIYLESEKILLVHGNPIKGMEFDYIGDSDEVIDTITELEARNEKIDVMFYGHTHCKAVYYRNNYSIYQGDVSYEWTEMTGDGVYIINPGSVGQPRDGDTFASAVLYDTIAKRYKFIKCSYYIENSLRDILEAGLPAWLGERLFKGK